MSTTFGIQINNRITKVALRASGEMMFINDLAPLLPNDTEVIALDNGQQGIYTIGDIKRAIETGDICPSHRQEGDNNLH